MGRRKICSLKTLTTELEDLQRAQSTAAEEHETIMRGHRLQIEELAFKISEQEKARHVEEKVEVTTNFLGDLGVHCLRFGKIIMSCVSLIVDHGLFICRNILTVVPCAGTRNIGFGQGATRATRSPGDRTG